MKAVKSMGYDLPPRIEFTVSEIREFWEMIEHQDNFVTLQSLPVVEPETLAQLESWVETNLREYMSDGYYGVRALSLLAAYFSSSGESPRTCKGGRSNRHSRVFNLAELARLRAADLHYQSADSGLHIEDTARRHQNIKAKDRSD